MQPFFQLEKVEGGKNSSNGKLRKIYFCFDINWLWSFRIFAHFQMIDSLGGEREESKRV